MRDARIDDPRLQFDWNQGAANGRRNDTADAPSILNTSPEAAPPPG
ncbi:hypothetical protein MYXA107069_16950 [Myxococcus xanthus]|nr:hypothetical protein MyxoNM_31730 [Myxococcus xanthus]SDY12566.1 hypothetical protein SAMN05444383_11932 [Myxococcus xanthus]